MDDKKIVKQIELSFLKIELKAGTNDLYGTKKKKKKII